MDEAEAHRLCGSEEFPVTNSSTFYCTRFTAGNSEVAINRPDTPASERSPLGRRVGNVGTCRLSATAAVSSQRKDCHTYNRHSYDYGDHPRLPLPCFCTDRLYANRDGLLASGGSCCRRWSAGGRIDLLAHEEALHCDPFALLNLSRVLKHSTPRADVPTCALDVSRNTCGMRVYRVGDEPRNTISS